MTQSSIYSEASTPTFLPNILNPQLLKPLSASTLLLKCCELCLIFFFFSKKKIKVLPSRALGTVFPLHLAIVILPFTFCTLH